MYELVNRKKIFVVPSARICVLRQDFFGPCQRKRIAAKAANKPEKKTGTTKIVVQKSDSVLKMVNLLKQQNYKR